jgi:uncharacterized protein DUF3551
MRFLLLMLGVLLGVAGIVAPAQAQNYPWCAMFTSPGGSQNCTFDTFEDCQKAVSSMGGFCDRNNVYVAPAPAPAPTAAPGRAQSPYSH